MRNVLQRLRSVDIAGGRDAANRSEEMTILRDYAALSDGILKSPGAKKFGFTRESIARLQSIAMLTIARELGVTTYAGRMPPALPERK